MNIFLTGGCGYKGTVLVPKLLAAGHTVGVLDTMWFGNFLESHPMDDMQIAEDMQLVVGHLLMKWLYKSKKEL